MSNRKKAQTGGDDVPAVREAKGKHRPAVIKWHINTVPEDGEGEGDFVASLPVEDDPESYIEEKESVEAGTLCRIVKGDGKGKIMTSHRYRKLGDGRRVAPAAADDEDDDDTDAGDVQGLGFVSLAEANRIAEEAARRAAAKTVERTQGNASAATSQLDEIEARVDRILERREAERTRIMEEVRAEYARLNPKRGERETTAPDADATIMGAVADMAKSDPTLAAKLVEHVFPSKDDGWLSAITKAAMDNPEVAQQLLGGVLVMGGQMFGSIFNRGGNTGAGQPATAAPGVQPDPMLVMLEPMRPIIEFITAELVNNADHADTLNLLSESVEQNPTLSMGLKHLVRMSSVEVLNLLARFNRQPIILKLRHGAAWIENLQAAIRGDSDDEDDEGEGGGDGEAEATAAHVPGSESSNGHKATGARAS